MYIYDVIEMSSFLPFYYSYLSHFLVFLLIQCCIEIMVDCI